MALRDATRPGSAPAELIAACQRGDERAFRRLFESHHAAVFRLAYRFVLNADEAADLTQDVFLRVFERIDTFRCECAFSTWLYRLATNVCLNHLRSRRTSAPADADGIEPRAATDDPAQSAAQGEMSEQVTASVSLLPDSLRAPFVLVAMEGLSYREAADVLAVSVEAARMRVSRARQQLRTTLKPYLEGGRD